MKKNNPLSQSFHDYKSRYKQLNESSFPLIKKQLERYKPGNVQISNNKYDDNHKEKVI